MQNEDVWECEARLKQRLEVTSTSQTNISCGKDGDHSDINWSRRQQLVKGPLSNTFSQ